MKWNKYPHILTLNDNIKKFVAYALKASYIQEWNKLNFH